MADDGGLVAVLEQSVKGIIQAVTSGMKWGIRAFRRCKERERERERERDLN